MSAIEDLKNGIRMAEAVPFGPDDETSPLDVLATYAKRAISEYEAQLAQRDERIAELENVSPSYGDVVAWATGLEMQLAQAQGELVAMREVLRNKIILARDILTEEGARLVEIGVMTEISPRAAQLGQLIEAVGKMAQAYDRLGVDTSDTLAHSAVAETTTVVIDAYRAAFPPAAGPASVGGEPGA